jgi:hypothetical protein
MCFAVFDASSSDGKTGNDEGQAEFWQRGEQARAGERER